jgi:hypothetical protein
MVGDYDVPLNEKQREMEERNQNKKQTKIKKQKFPDRVDKEIHNNNNNNKHSLRSNTKGYGGKTH